MPTPHAHWGLLALAAALCCCCCCCCATAASLPSDFCSKRSMARYSHPSSCSDFVVCFQGAVWSQERCPACPAPSLACAGQARMAFDEASQRCVWPSQLCSPTCPTGCPTGTYPPPAFATADGATGASSPAPPPPRTYLLVWAGPANSSLCNDALFVLDADPHSPAFGQVVAVAEAPTGGNEPHHVGLSEDGQVLAAGGLLAVLKGQPDILFFNVSDPLHPTFLTTADPPLSSVTDEFVPVPGGGFIVSMMGSADGSAPGRIVRINPDLTVAGEYPADPPTDGFNPHGIAVDFKRGRMVSADYVLPSSTLLPSPAPVFRTTFRVWDMANMSIIKTFDVGAEHASGMMEARMLGDTEMALVTSGRGILYGVNLSNPDAGTKPVLYVGNETNHCLAASFANGTRAVASVFGMDVIQLYDTSDPWHFKLMQELYLPAGSGPHYVTLSPDHSMAAVSTYFLDEGGAGLVKMGGSRQIYLFDIVDGGNRLMPNLILPSIDFKVSALEATGSNQCGPWRPHGMAFKQVPATSSSAAAPVSEAQPMSTVQPRVTASG